MEATAMDEVPHPLGTVDEYFTRERLESMLHSDEARAVAQKIGEVMYAPDAFNTQVFVPAGHAAAPPVLAALLHEPHVGWYNILNSHTEPVANMSRGPLFALRNSEGILCEPPASMFIVVDGFRNMTDANQLQVFNLPNRKLLVSSASLKENGWHVASFARYILSTEMASRLVQLAQAGFPAHQM
jgi:hypothetical protein